MMESSTQWLVIAIVALPGVAVLALGLSAWLRRLIEERAINAVVAVAFAGSAIAAAVLIAFTAATGAGGVIASAGDWFAVEHYHFTWVLIADRLSLPFTLFCALLVGLIGAFSRRYLHREPGYLRFYLLLALFGAGVELVLLAGTLDLLFFGWEIVGLASAMLIAFFNERAQPVEHGLRAFATYRVCDTGLLAAAVWLHHAAGSSTAVLPAPGATPWMGFVGPGDQFQATAIALLLLWASIGKSAQLPLGGWLPRAMEGPTPSSAIFYGAISIHLGAYLLLRSAPLLEQAPIARLMICLVGGATALHATFVGRVQSDIKSALAYASMTQVGIIFVEIGLGFHHLALAHIVGHAAIRSLQILRSPSLLHDHHQLERAMGQQLPRTGGHIERIVPAAIQPWLYRHALERGYIDALLFDFVVRPVLRLARELDHRERQWTSHLANGRARPTMLDQRDPVEVS